MDNDKQTQNSTSQNLITLANQLLWDSRNPTQTKTSFAQTYGLNFHWTTHTPRYHTPEAQLIENSRDLTATLTLIEKRNRIYSNPEWPNPALRKEAHFISTQLYELASGTSFHTTTPLPSSDVLPASYLYDEDGNPTDPATLAIWDPGIAHTTLIAPWPGALIELGRAEVGIALDVYGEWEKPLSAAKSHDWAVIGNSCTQGCGSCCREDDQLETFVKSYWSYQHELSIADPLTIIDLRRPPVIAALLSTFKYDTLPETVTNLLEMAATYLSPVQQIVWELKTKQPQLTNQQIAARIREQLDKNLGTNYISTIWKQQIPPALAASIVHFQDCLENLIDIGDTSIWRKCKCCGATQLMNEFNFTRRGKGYGTTCKRCLAKIRKLGED